MHFTRYIKNFLLGRQSTYDSESDVEVKKLFGYLQSLINKKSLISPEINALKKAFELPEEERKWALVQVYYLFESFLVENKPPVVSEDLKKEDLRWRIRQKIDLTKIEENLRIVLLPEREKAVLLYESFVAPLSKYLKTRLGLKKLESVLSENNQSDVFKGIRVSLESSNAFDFGEFNKRVVSNEKVAVAEIIATFKKLYNVLYESVKGSFGREISDKIIEDTYFRVKKSYEYDIVSMFLEALPLYVLESERVSYLSREDLERAILERTRELKEEKEKVEEKVRERTTELESEKNKLSAITSNMKEGALLIDSSNNVIFANQSVKKILNVNEPEEASENFWGAFSKKFPKVNVKEAFTKCQSGKNFVIPEYEVGSEEIYKLSFDIVYNSFGKGEISFIWIENITEVKLLDRKKSEFIAVAAHQLRTPLSGLKWMLHMLIKGDLGPLSNDQKAFLMKSYESNERMIVLVNEMLGASRVESGKLKISPISISLPDLVDNFLVEVKSEAKKGGVKIVFSKKDVKDLPEVFADPEKIRAVFQNLLENAIKYTKKDGGVEIKMKDEDDHILVSIKDNGIGIPEKDHKKIFERFFRSENAVKVKTDGSGLGLFVAKNIIEKHGGRIWFESEENKGTTFFFTLPKDKNKKKT